MKLSRERIGAWLATINRPNDNLSQSDLQRSAQQFVLVAGILLMAGAAVGLEFAISNYIKITRPYSRCISAYMWELLATSFHLWWKQILVKHQKSLKILWEWFANNILRLSDVLPKFAFTSNDGRLLLVNMVYTSCLTSWVTT